VSFHIRDTCILWIFRSHLQKESNSNRSLLRKSPRNAGSLYHVHTCVHSCTRSTNVHNVAGNIHVYTCKFIFIFTYVYSYMCTYVYIYTYTYVYTHTYIFVYIDTPECVGTLSVEFHVCVYTCIYVHIYIHVLPMYSIMINLHICTYVYTLITNVQYYAMRVYVPAYVYIFIYTYYKCTVFFHVCVYNCIHIYI